MARTAQAGRTFEAAALRFAFGPLVVDIARVAFDGADAELTGVQASGPVAVPARAGGPAWTLAPLAGLDGSVRARIVDAALLFDADVTLPVEAGGIRFDDASVEHVGPDSRMGVSPTGLYVDAPNGRSYLYQFPATPVDGVDFEKRGALLGPWVSERGSLALQPFVEGLLRQGAPGAGSGFTGQSKLLFERTSLSGDLRPGDGAVAGPGLQAELAGRAQGRNAIHLHSESVGRGVDADIPSLSLRHVQVEAGGLRLACDAVDGALKLRLFVERGQLQVVLEVPQLRLAGVKLQAAVQG